MKVETSRFGSLSVGEADIVSFPEGMLGFSKIHEYALVESADDSLFLWLQALKKPSVAFPLLEPEIFEKNYKIELIDEDKDILKLGKNDKIKVFAIVTIPSDPTKMTANMKAPIVINLKKKLARQVILHTLDYPIRQAIFADLQSYCAGTSRTIFPDTADAEPAYHAIALDGELGSRLSESA